MTNTHPLRVARCRCGAVELGAWAEPLAVTACYCDDCQTAAQRIADERIANGQTANGQIANEPIANGQSTDLPDAPPLTDANGGTEFMLFRRDRVACTRGAEQLRAMRLTDKTKTRRMIAACCTTPMYVTFDDKRPWVSAFRASFAPDAPPVQMRICTRFRRPGARTDDGLPDHPGYPPAIVVRILAAWPRMLFSRPVGTLP
jgi:hypothetical protein